jgi:hypothetical protein
MEGPKNIPAGGGQRRRELTDFGLRLASAIAASHFPTKRAFVIAANIEPSQLNRYCVVGGTVPNIGQVQRWASLLRCRVSELVPDLPSSDGSEASEKGDSVPLNPEVERLIVDARCTAVEAELLRAAGRGPMPVSYLVAHSMLHEYRLGHRSSATTASPRPKAPPDDASHVRATDELPAPVGALRKRTAR